jgi:hypothetical protein
MSQSDYLKYKRVATILKVDNNTSKQPPVFGSGVYADNMEFSLENSIVNTKQVFNRLTLSTGWEVDSDIVTPVPIWGMDKVVSGCTEFPICVNTHLRTNRVPMATVRFDPLVKPLTIDERNELSNLKTACKCKPGSKNADGNACSCSLGRFGIVR